MATNIPQPPPGGRGATFWQGLVSHRPLQRFFEWLFQGAAILSVFMIVVCSIIIACELSAHDAFATGFLHTLGVGAEDALNAAIEAAMLGCVSLAKRARLEQNGGQEKRMHTMGGTFLILTIATVGFNVFHASDQMDQILLWVRCAAGLIYCYVSHMTDDHEGAQVQQQMVHDQIGALVEQFNRRLEEVQEAIRQGVQTQVQTLLQNIPAQVHTQATEQLRGVHASMQEQAHTIAQFSTQAVALQELAASLQTTMSSVPSTVQEQVQSILAEWVQNAQYTEQATAMQELAASLQEVKREIRTTITEVRTVTKQDSALVAQTAALKGAKGGTKESLKLVRAPIVEATSAPAGQSANASEGVQERVQKFIQDRLAQGCKPKLGEIEVACNVSRHTAIKYRRALLGDDDNDNEVVINQ